MHLSTSWSGGLSGLMWICSFLSSFHEVFLGLCTYGKLILEWWDGSYPEMIDFNYSAAVWQTDVKRQETKTQLLCVLVLFFSSWYKYFLNAITNSREGRMLFILSLLKATGYSESSQNVFKNLSSYWAKTVVLLPRSKFWMMLWHLQCILT